MDAPPQPQLFLSYARVDRARVARIAAALSAAGLNVWWDTAIETGSRFSADIERALNAADVVVVIWSAASVNSTWVLDEAGAGRDRGRLVPVQIDATLPPLGFRQYQATDLSGWKGRASDPKFVALVAAIQNMAGSEVANPAPPALPATTGPSRRALIGGAAGVAALAAGGFGAWKFLGQKADDGTASVVVLPFANLSGDPAQAFFSDGIAEELRNALSQIPGLKVIGRVSSEKFRDTDDLPAAAEKLGVDHVLTGSVRRSPNTIRIAAQLVDGRSGVESWSASYDQPVGDALAIQSKIATNVVAALSAKLGAAVGQIVVGGTRNPEAQALFLQAEQLGRSGQTKDISRQQLALLDAAIALDPRYADAWSLKGNVISNSRNFVTTAQDVMQLRDQAMAASERAVVLAPNSGLARASLSIQHRNRLEIRPALADVETALRLAPTDARVVNVAGDFLRLINPDRGVAIARDAVTLDPLNPLYVANYAVALLSVRRLAEALIAARQAMAMSQNQYGGNALVTALFGLGRYDEARANLRYVVVDPIRATLTAMIEARTGNRATFDAALAATKKIDDGSAYLRASMVHAQRGETGLALDAIEASFRARETLLYQVAVVFGFDPIRNEPRFKAVQDAVIPPDLYVPPKRRPA